MAEDIVTKNVLIESDNLTKRVVDAAFSSAGQLADAYGMRHERDGNTFSVYVPVNNSAPYDMKPAFERSKKVQYTKEGSWYLIVPIARQTTRMNSQLAKNVSLAFSNALNASTQYIEGLYNQRSQTGLPLQQSMNGNLTKMRDNLGRTNYMAFRTVSAKSDVNSWIIGKNRMTDNRTDKMVNDIENLIRQVVGA